MYWEPDNEGMHREELEQLQLERLQATLNRVYGRVPFYRKQLDAAGVAPEDVVSLGDLARLPFTTKADLRDNYPYGLFAVPMREVVRIHASSGTTGTPTVVGYTRNDIRTWSNLVARILTMGGVTKDDVIQIAFGYGLFTGAFGLHYGAERVGASVIPASSGNTARQIKIMQDFKTTALVSTPSYALLIGDTVRGDGDPPVGPVAEVGAVRRRAVVGRHAAGDRGPAGDRGHRQLRPVRGHRARRLGRVPGAERAAHQRGPFHRGGGGPGDAPAGAAGRAWGSWSSPRSPKRRSP